MKSKFTLLATALIMPMMFACYALSPHENFKRTMNGNIGKKMNESSTLWIKSDRHILTRNMQNGNMEGEYILDDACHYFFEFNPETRIIVNWRFEGSERDCAIPP